ncbi:MAG: class I SAM-dependent methyltransferase [Spiribacter salinus]|uniref:Class I SAM-dependent methyltransferase n=1 Tax=Spiribacter salinus TaxID=1335746 RepID=A0A540VU21_9GAMM|nr:MAG: class I SAM-dependent methyltransferase [Spiribacter salinus]
MTATDTQSPWRWPQDAVRFLRATVTNQLARFAPNSYVRLTGETGRGREAVPPEEVAAYFRECVADYRAQLTALGRDPDAVLRDARILEYGPGDIPGVALLLIAQGAAKVVCVDRFPLVRTNLGSDPVLRALEAELDRDAARRFRAACEAGEGNTASLEYRIRPSGVSGEQASVDLILSRAVLEHVNDLDATFGDMRAALRPGGLAMHKVDLRSHGLHNRNRLDFLRWPAWAWRWMHSCKGTPNRIRLTEYRRLAERHQLEVLALSAVERAGMEEVHEVRPHLAAPFRDVPDEDLEVLSFWLILRKPDMSEG